MIHEDKNLMGDGQPSKASWKEKCYICNQKTMTKPLLMETNDAYRDRTSGLSEPLRSGLEHRLPIYVCFSCFVSPDEDHEWDVDGNYPNLRHRQQIWYSGDYNVEYPIRETVRDIEDLVKHLNQTKNEGRHEVRTIKDKDNQKAIDCVSLWANSELQKEYPPEREDEHMTRIGSVEQLSNLIKEKTGKDIKDL
jgi:hypothetical protein